MRDQARWTFAATTLRGLAMARAAWAMHGIAAPAFWWRAEGDGVMVAAQLAPAARPTRCSRADPVFRVVDVAELAVEPEAWDDLVALALEPHPYNCRKAIEAHRASGLVPAELPFVRVRHGGRLNALIPFRLAPNLSALEATVARPFATPFVSSTAPLVAGDRPLDGRWPRS